MTNRRPRINLPIWMRVAGAITVLFAATGGALVLWTTETQKDMARRQAEDLSESVHHVTVAGHMELMEDETGRKVERLQENINSVNTIRNLTVYPADSLRAEFPQVRRFAREGDEHIKRVLQTGRPDFSIVKNQSVEYLRVIRPILSSENYMGHDCTACHNGKPGAVLAVTNMEISLEKVTEANKMFQIRVIVAGLAVFAVLLICLYFVSRILIARPLQGVQGVLARVADGDLRSEFQIKGAGEIVELLDSMRKSVDNLSQLVSSMRAEAADSVKLAGSLSSTAGEFRTIATELSASTEESSASIEELNASLSVVSNTVQNANSNADQIDTAIGDLHQTAGQVNASSLRLHELAEDANAKANSCESPVRDAGTAMNLIRESSASITQIISIISGISDRTNMLSLNAAIEAARVGEAGRGFAVVADEISKLAENTVRSVNQIKSFINTTNSAVENGFATFNQVAELLNSMVSAISEMRRSSEVVQDAMSSQAKASELVSGNTKQFVSHFRTIRDSTLEHKQVAVEVSRQVELVAVQMERLAGGAHKVAEVSEQMLRHADQLQALTDRFQTKV